jgi:HSP20 family molecular chaperone IbpA
MHALITSAAPQNPLFSLLNPFIRMFEGVNVSWKAMVQSTAGRVPEPAFAMEESASTYLLKAFLPGAAREGIHVAIEGDEIRVGAKCETRYHDGQSGAFTYVRQKTVEERFHLPVDALADGLRTDFADGILYVAIPRRMALAEGA